ncbi:WD40-repeat-containing domain protein [Phyllosticta citrichinensis]|uniref:WD40-repeat-containing domain protein n=1 Tax=Phyllosticta citrichinensis TaxID=1130410 RepID=A0ABR1XH41_9PEZI
MSDALPKIRVTDTHSRESAPLSAAPAESPLDNAFDDGGHMTPASSTRSLSSGNMSQSNTSKDQVSTGTRPSKEQPPADKDEGIAMVESQAPIDPLSQQIFKRTNTQTDVLQKFRSAPEDAANATTDNAASPKTSREVNKSDVASLAPSKKKGVSFLSRFIGNKKKDAAFQIADDDASSVFRPEGMDAELFSQPIDNFGYSPRHPQPPRYIKIRAKFKKEKEFDRVFLAQELRTKPPGQDEQRPTTSGGSGSGNPPRQASDNPVWALEFSKDGKYLAAGGQDKVVRVWAVIANPEERAAHEQFEEVGNWSLDGSGLHLNAPVFQKKTFREYKGHESTILDLSWSKNNFLLSSSMDKTVRLWHISRPDCLCTFKHADFVPSIQFHPKDDRFFLAGSLDTKLRLWSIPDKSVAFWNQLPEMITAVSFTPDGKTAVAGTLNGLCLFYDTDGLKYQTQLHVKSNRGKNSKGSKITGIQVMQTTPGAPAGEVKLLVSSNDSRIRLYSFRDKGLEIKFRGQENNYSQIRASFSDDAKYVICGSEDHKAYIWSTGPTEGDNRSQRPVEIFEAHNSIATCAIMAPTKTRQLLSGSEDPVYDLCNPPPVTLVSRTESVSSKPNSENGSVQGTPKASNFKRAQETPAYIARSAHADGQIIVTADYTGCIKVFRQDCAFVKRKNAHDNWDAGSVFSRKTVGSGKSMGLGIGVRRSNSTKTQSSNRNRRDSTATTDTQPSSDRILSWRQNIAGSGASSIRNGKTGGGRSASPNRFSIASARSSHARIDNGTPSPLPNHHHHHLHENAAAPAKKRSDPNLRPQTSGGALGSHSSPQSSQPPLPVPRSQRSSTNPHGDAAREVNGHGNGNSQQENVHPTWKGQKKQQQQQQPAPAPAPHPSASFVSQLSSEADSSVEGEGDAVVCRACGCRKFNAKVSDAGHRLVCARCGAGATSA